MNTGRTTCLKACENAAATSCPRLPAVHAGAPRSGAYTPMPTHRRQARVATSPGIPTDHDSCQTGGTSSRARTASRTAAALLDSTSPVHGRAHGHAYEQRMIRRRLDEVRGHVQEHAHGRLRCTCLQTGAQACVRTWAKACVPAMLAARAAPAEPGGWYFASCSYSASNGRSA